ncbi:MAG: hypothetical protein ACI8RD_000198 [Bacillariaceae sp.]|jgi:hypothetical protein
MYPLLRSRPLHRHRRYYSILSSVSTVANKTTTTTTTKKVSFHFASSEYAKCFRDQPEPDVNMLKQSAVDFLDTFDKESWYKDPVSYVHTD